MNKEKEQSSVLVIGAGLMGSGIAHAFAVAGDRVQLHDANPLASEKAVTNIREVLNAAVALKKLQQEEVEAVVERITIVADMAAAAATADLVVETATEDLAIKLDIIKMLSTAARPDAFITSNTSALSITELAAATRHPERFAGLHFFNPVHKMKLVEIVRGLETSKETVEYLQACTKCMGKQSVVVADSPGFTTSRMSAMLGNEAMYMLQDGVASAEDIDTALRLGLGHPMGPLELGDLTGWDTRLSVLHYLNRTLGERFRPCPLIEEMVKAGRTGRKVGHGVYEYKDGQKVAGSGLSTR
ncbi:MAG: 3-hydroxyacyl-CoA dehydrogenase NAD-binding domain-containing protein [Gammaproteobacteria bacterium]|nr:3-hydroxyacyl-CoA dehydrogenase NAD-binding domain-containing protein [Gammaproteobacteria bacterium]